ncbi:unnamed protein product [Effrenium voratum]|uniref:Peptidase S54 rhomboid domain-containing protein n=1 Tax=Effrenium voratum TaxID=2562239 RepID=A0AA36NNC6_9DINO|nr:unnamed protein product [Effrenium voratum]CAJ1427456.1 unnamed protein product [Effrenium voratum]
MTPFGHHELEYLVGLAPLVFGMVAMPTMEEAFTHRLSFQRQVLVAPADALPTLRRCVLTKSTLEQGEWWRLFTYMFVHRDWEHVWTNIGGLLCNGFAAFTQFGHISTYGVFLLSGLLAGTNSWGRAYQTKAQLQASVADLPQSFGPVRVPNLLRECWASTKQATANWTAPRLSGRTDIYGASGGVCGLMGFNLGLWAHRVWRHLRADAESFQLRNVAPSFATLATALQSASFLAQEWRSLHGDAGFTGVDHAGHLTGFAVGLVCAVAAVVLQDDTS